MRRQRLAIGVAVVVAFVVAVAVREGRGGRATPGPAVTTAQAIAEAKAAGRRVVLCFRSGVNAETTCESCRKMGDVRKLVEPKLGAEVVWIDVSLDPMTFEHDLVEEYAVTAKPTTLLVDPDGTIVDSHLGYWPPEKLLARIGEWVER